ncbi:MAG: histidine phosphatase family protein [Actinomycetia bacterium]|nr:histidine phosphatase family protein [Actinomycetes bacterium]
MRSTSGLGDCQAGRVWSSSSHVFVARHGETEWNRAGRRQGQPDSPLTRRGEQHAQKVTELCKAWARLHRG